MLVVLVVLSRYAPSRYAPIRYAPSRYAPHALSTPHVLVGSLDVAMR